MGGAVAESFELRSGARLVRRGLGAPARGAALATGLPALDLLLPDGGLPEGRLTEVTGRRGSGKLSLALTIAARRLAAGDAVALVDPARSVCPDIWSEPLLERLLVVRGGGIETALRAADALLRSGAFPLLVLDLPGRAAALRGEGGRGSLPVATFVRLTREALAACAAVLLVSEWLPWRTNGLASLVTVRLEVRRLPAACGSGRIEVAITKSKLGPEGGRVVLELEPSPSAGPPPAAAGNGRHQEIDRRLESAGSRPGRMPCESPA